jgi:hypothetical protein
MPFTLLARMQYLSVADRKEQSLQKAPNMLVPLRSALSKLTRLRLAFTNCTLFRSFPARGTSKSDHTNQQN